jgi:DNA-binding HxlR family transcriptional regulator
MNFYLKRKWSLRVLRDTFFTQRGAKDLRRERKEIDGIESSVLF